jgi:hypothetical protein
MVEARDCVHELAELLEICVKECAGDREKGIDLFDRALEFEPDLAAFLADERNKDVLREVAKRALAPTMDAFARARGFADYAEMVEEIARLLRAANRLH